LTFSRSTQKLLILSLHVPIRSLANLPSHDASRDVRTELLGTAAALRVATASSSTDTLTLTRDAGVQRVTLSGRLALGAGVSNCVAAALQPTGSGASAPSSSSASVLELSPLGTGTAALVFGSDTSTAPALVKLPGDSTLYLVGSLHFTGGYAAKYAADCDAVPPPSPPPSPPPPSPPPPAQTCGTLTQWYTCHQTIGTTWVGYQSSLTTTELCEAWCSTMTSDGCCYWRADAGCNYKIGGVPQFHVCLRASGGIAHSRRRTPQASPDVLRSRHRARRGTAPSAVRSGTQEKGSVFTDGVAAVQL
jgi:hypothetical protein